MNSKTSYSGLERKFDDMVPSWIVPVGRVLRELEIGNKDTGNLRWGFRVTFSGKTVSKATPINENGLLTWKRHDTKFAIPDFVVLDKNGLDVYNRMVEQARRGFRTVNPFNQLMCDSGYYIEVLGTYYHSGEYVCGLSKKEHEKEIIEAYESVGAHVLLLWEDEIDCNWMTTGLPKLKQFLELAGKVLELPAWDCKEPPKGDDVDVDVWRCLFGAEHFRELSSDRKEIVLERMFNHMRAIDFPWIGRDVAMYDLERFRRWSSGSKRKPTRFGSDFCACFTHSMSEARVKGEKSRFEIWHDEDLLKKSILWQMENENGRHHANRFLNAMSSVSNFRIVNSLHPSFIAMFLTKNFGDLTGKTVYDPCAGWGSRLLAVTCLGGKYLSIDANQTLVKELGLMSKELGSDSYVLYGDSSRKEYVKTLFKAGKVEKADYVFTSPPYFDAEEYSNGEFESCRGRDYVCWMSEFMIPMVKNSLDVLKDDGVAIFNVWKNFDVELVRQALGVEIEDEDVFIEHGGRRSKERMLTIRKSKTGFKKSCLIECKICHRQFESLGWHLRKEHQISSEEYLKIFSGSKTVSENRIAAIKKDNSTHTKERIKRTAYRCPDGSIVGKQDAWKRAWGETTPPEDSVVDGGLFDHWKDKVEGVDFVVCSFCGYRSKNLARHLNREHGGVSGYKGEVKSTNCQKKLSVGACASWDKRGRSDKRDISKNKTHKKHGLTKEILERLSVEEGLSDCKIGKLYEISGAGVSYLRKKFGIKSNNPYALQTLSINRV